MKTVTIEVQAVEIASFGKADYCYKPMCPKGVKLVSLGIALSSKPESKRTTFSLPMMQNITREALRGDTAIDFKVTDIKPLIRVKPLALGSNPVLFYSSGDVVTESVQMNFNFLD